MAGSFLEEQVERIRRMTAELSRMQGRAAALSHEIARDREQLQHDQLHAVRNYRPMPQPAESPGRPVAREGPKRKRRA